MSLFRNKWLRRSLIVVVGILVLTIGSLVLITSTESGTRWLLARVAATGVIDIDSAGSRGTLLTTVNIPLLRYDDESTRIEIRKVSITLDWSATTPGAIAVDALAVDSIAITLTPADTDDDGGPIAMPALPVDIYVRSLRLSELSVDDFRITELAVEEIAAIGRTFSAASITADLDPIRLQLREADITIVDDLPVGAEFAWQMIDGNWSGSGNVSGSLETVNAEHRLEGDYRIASRGTVQILGQPVPVFDLQNEFASVAVGDWTASDGRVHAAGTLDRFRLEIEADISSELTPLSNISGTAAGDLQGFDELDVTISNEVATVRASGALGWAPEITVDLTLASRGIDPSQFAAVPGGSLDSELRLQATSVESFTIDIVNLSGLWNGQETSVSGRFARRGETWNCTDCLAVVGSNRLSISGGIEGRAIDTDIDIDAPALGQLMPAIAGSLRAAGQLRGSLSVPVLSGNASGEALGFGDWSLDRLTIESPRSSVEELELATTLDGLGFGETRFGSGSVRLAGELEDATVQFDWLRDDIAAEAELRLVLGEESVSGELLAASLTESLTGTWQLDGPTEFMVSPDEQWLSPATWSNDGMQFRHEELRRQSEALSLDASLQDVPLELLNRFVPANVRLSGSVDANADLDYGVDGWNGTLDWRQDNTIVQFIDNEDRYDGNVPQATADVKIVNNSAVVNANLRTEFGTEASLAASLTEIGPAAVLDARLQLNGDRWDWVPRMFPRIDEFSGRIATDIRARGSLQSPDLTGEAAWSGGTLTVPEWNLALNGIGVTASGSSAGDMTVAGEATSGDGVMRINGDLQNVTSATPSFDLRLTGEQATILNWEDLHLVASPNLEVKGDLDGVRITGSVAMDEAEIVIQELPEGAVSPSDDVSVEGRELPARRRTRVSGNVEILLADNIHINAFGLDTNLQGQLRFTIAEDRPPQGHGELRLVGGVFEAYGQKLEIETGTMVFTGPLDDPLINVRAVRRIESDTGTIVAGINLTGRAQALSSTLFSEPTMSQADTLSYLLLGRPLSDASAADGSSLSNTAYSLGLRQAALITNQIGQTVGLDEFRVSGSNQNSTELIAGKQINSRLYARYAYGVFRRVGKLLMRYKLNDRFSIEVAAGEHQSMDILYTVEKE